MFKAFKLAALLGILSLAMACTTSDEANNTSSDAEAIDFALSSTCPSGASSCGGGYCLTYSKKSGDQTKYGAANVASLAEARALLKGSGIRRASLSRGTCAEQSTACTMDYRPVCGSIDGGASDTYGNECAFLVTVRQTAGDAGNATGLYKDGQCKDVVSCDYNGRTYYPGDSWTADDGCNTCFCGDNGTIGCTLMLCR